MPDPRPPSSPSVRSAVLLVVDGTEVAEVLVADTYALRARGMLARRPLPEALLLVPGGSVHGVGMTTSLDVAMLRPLPTERSGAGDRGGGRRQVLGGHQVLRTARLRPFGLVGPRRGVCSTLEAPAGSFARWGLSTTSVVELRAGRPRA